VTDSNCQICWSCSSARCEVLGVLLLIAVAMGSYLLVASEEDTEAVQGAMVRVARSLHQEGGVEQGERGVSIAPIFNHVCVSDTR
jgi:hypothetical protein